MNPTEARPFALLANDFHVGLNNIAEFEKNWEEMLEVCREYGVKNVFIGGDLYESRAGQDLDVLLAVRRAFNRLRHRNLEAYIIDGNHDKKNGSSTFSYNNIFADCVPGVHFIDTFVTMYIANSDVVVYLLSYFDNKQGKFDELFNHMLKNFNPKYYNILYCHQGISGGLSKLTADELPAEIFQPFNLVLAGHYHNRKQIPDTNIEYIGSSRQHNFGEDTEKGYTILYTDGTTDFVQNEANIRFVTYETDFKGIKDIKEEIERRSPELQKQESVRLIVNCTEEEAKKIDSQGLKEAGFSKVEAKSQRFDHEITQADFKAKYDKAGIKEEYRSYCATQDVRADEIEMGIQYLDKIKEETCGA